MENDTLIGVPVTTGERFTMGPPKRLFRDSKLAYPVPVPNYDVSPDGKKFVLVEPIDGGEPERIVVVQTGSPSSVIASRTKSPETNYIERVRG